MFLHMSVCPQGGMVSQHALQVSGGCIPACLEGFQAHTQGGAWGVWPGGALQAHTLGGLQAHTLGQGVSRPTSRGYPCPHPGEGVYPNMHWGRTPPSWRLLQRAVRILLECILVCVYVMRFVYIYIIVSKTVPDFYEVMRAHVVSQYFRHSYQ